MREESERLAVCPMHNQSRFDRYRFENLIVFCPNICYNLITHIKAFRIKNKGLINPHRKDNSFNFREGVGRWGKPS